MIYIDTPMTNERVVVIDGNRWVNAPFARSLERELNESNKIIRQQQLLDEENLMLKERIKRLEEAGQELLFDNDNMANIYRWHKAKEAKL